MGIKNAVLKTIAYYRRNGLRAAFFAALERLHDNRNENYTFVPVSDAAYLEQKKEYKLLAEAGNTVRFSIVVPLFNTPENYLREMIESVTAQSYGNWELVLADASPAPILAVKKYIKDDPRIRYFYLGENNGISENTNRGIEKALGDYIGLLDHDDLLTTDALYEMSRVIRNSMKKNRLSRYSKCPVRLIYSDEDKFDSDTGSFYEHHRKPPFNMDYLLSNNYICHFTMIRADVIKRLKERSLFDGAQDYDLILRTCSEAALWAPDGRDQIVHIDRVLYHWRCHSQSTAANPGSKTYAYEAGRRVLETFLSENGLKGRVEELAHVGFYRVFYEPDVFSARPDIGCVGGRILDPRKRLIGGMYTKDGRVVFEGLRDGYSGGLQHRAVLTQDAAAVDIRCIYVRKELIPVFEDITGEKYREGGAGLPDRSPEDIRKMSLLFGEEIRKRGFRILWDPAIVLKI